jgi:hypothetical protein
LLNPNFLLAHRNIYSEGTDNAQKTSLIFIPTLKIYVFSYSGRTNRLTD